MDDDGDDKDDTKRRTRNLSEKKRRDQFNMLVTELSSLITSNNRKMDKSTVLKSTISFLKNHNEETVRSRAHDVQENWKPAFLTNEEFTYLILEALEGFVLVFSASGRIYYASDSIFPLLGHNSVDIVNKSIFDLTFEDDRHNLYNLLQRNASSTEHMPGLCTENELLRFQIHLRRGNQDFRNNASYDLVQFYGHSRTSHEPVNDDPDMMNYQQDLDSSVIFICIGRLHTPQLISKVSLVDSNRNEFTSRHSLEWKFLFLDHRAPPIIGYLPFEVLGTSGYDYYHFDDLEKVVTCHEALMQKGELTSGYYRFLTKGQQWIWLQTRFYITYHQWNSKPEFVVCTHQVISHADVIKTLKEESVDQTEDVNETTEIEKKIGDPSEDPIRPMPPLYLSEPASDAYANTYQPISQLESVKSAAAGSTTSNVAACVDAEGSGASWTRALTSYTAGSDTASQSRDARSPQRNPELETQPTEASLVSQHGMGAQYLDPACSYSSVPVPDNILPVPTMQPTPVLARTDQGQVQEQLQRKHEELQQMIVRQQEELRQVKEQLMLARFGMLQPMNNVPNPYSTEEMQSQLLMPQIEYANAAPSPAITYSQQASVQQPSQPSLSPQPLQPLQPTQQPSSPQPPHATEPHQQCE